MAKCGKGCMPECGYFTTGGCVSPFNCMYKIERESITTATSTPLDLDVTHVTDTDKDNEIARLQAENAVLRARLEKAVELPCKVGDVVHFIPTYNGNPIWGIQKGIIQMIGITRRGIHLKKRNNSNFGKTYMLGKSAFLDKFKAEKRLAELGGEK